jgi:hypothetical protein
MQNALAGHPNNERHSVLNSDTPDALDTGATNILHTCAVLTIDCCLPLDDCRGLPPIAACCSPSRLAAHHRGLLPTIAACCPPSRPAAHHRGLLPTIAACCPRSANRYWVTYPKCRENTCIPTIFGYRTKRDEVDGYFCTAHWAGQGYGGCEGPEPAHR